VSIRRLLIAFLCAGAVPVAHAAVDIYSIGVGSQFNWASQGLIEAAVEFTDDYVQPSGFTVEDNIIATLDWVDTGGTPDDLMAEGQSRVWSNVAAAAANANLVMVDGDSTTSTGALFKANGVRQTGRVFNWDLGASFPVNRIVFYPSPRGASEFVRGYEMRINDGLDFDREGRPKFVLLRRDELNTKPRVEIPFPQQLVRFIQLRILAPSPFEIGELEVYGNGFVPRGRYESNFLSFDVGLVNLGRMRVRAERFALDGNPAGLAQARLEVRSGNDESPQIFYSVNPETQSETEISQADYNRLEENRRTVRYDSENWSAWSKPLALTEEGDFELDLKDLPGPRPFFQFALTFIGTSSEIIRIRDLDFTFSRPLAGDTFGEVALDDDPIPLAGVASTTTGQRARFVYSARGSVGSGDPGFDGVRIQTPDSAEFISLAIDDPANLVDPDSVVIEEGALSVYFPSHRVGAGQSIAVWVRFDTTPLFYSTLFRGWLLDTSGDLPQPLTAGDAGHAVGTNSLLVFGSLGKALGRFDLSTPVVTPNGDGRNDTVDIEYDLVYLVGAAEVSVAIYDLSGRLMRRLAAADQAAGSYHVAWDGTAAGRIVPPGNYICRIEVIAQDASFDRSVSLVVAY